jgi:hypothetical protein
MAAASFVLRCLPPPLPLLRSCALVGMIASAVVLALGGVPSVTRREIPT